MSELLSTMPGTQQALDEFHDYYLKWDLSPPKQLSTHLFLYASTHKFTTIYMLMKEDNT